LNKIAPRVNSAVGCLILRLDKMAERISEQLQAAVVNNFTSIDRVLKFFLSLAGIICLLKFTNKLTLSVSGVEVPTKWAWVVFLFFTVAHAFTTWRFEQSTQKFLQSNRDNDGQKAFEKITSSGGPWVRNLVPRRKRGNLYRMKWSDPSTLVSYSAAVVMAISVIQFDLNHPKIILGYSAVALVIVVINWLIGSRWAVTLSQLAVDPGNVASGAPTQIAPLSL
jgi:hypothetical protein